MGKYDLDLENDILTWIAGVMGDPDLFKDVSGDKAVQAKLKDGLTLIALMNKIKDKSIPKYNKKAKMPFQCMENLGLVNEAMKAYGVQEDYLFVTNDLYTGKNMFQVQIGLRALGDLASANGVEPKLTVTSGKPRDDF